MSATQIAQRALLADTDEGRNGTTHRSIREIPTLTSTLQLSKSQKVQCPGVGNNYKFNNIFTYNKAES